MFARGIEGEAASAISVAVISVLGIYFLATSILVIVASQKMKNPEKRKLWSIIAIVCSIIGTGTIFGLIGGILGLLAEK